MTKTKLVWRLREQPTSEMLRELVSSGILTKDEAREILFSSETEDERDKKSLESEIKFLRELVAKLSNSNSEIITVVKKIEVPYHKYPWYGPYATWCGGTQDLTCGGSNTITVDCASGSNIAANTSFSDIKTF